MEKSLTEIKNALTAMLKKIDPDTDVFFEQIPLTSKESGFSEPERYYFLDIIPTGNETVDRFFTDRGVLIDITYHEKKEKNSAYLEKAALLDEAVRPVFSFGKRHITIENTSSKIVDNALHFSFPIIWRTAREETVTLLLAEELEITMKKGE